LANHYRNKCSVPFPEQSGSDVDECGYLRPVCRTEAKRLLLLIMTAVVGTVRYGSAESARKPNVM